MDMAVMDCEVKNDNVVTLEVGITAGGRAIYGISWWKKGKREYTWYRSMKTAFTTFSMICRMI